MKLFATHHTKTGVPLLCCVTSLFNITVRVSGSRSQQDLLPQPAATLEVVGLPATLKRCEMEAFTSDLTSQYGARLFFTTADSYLPLEDNADINASQCAVLAVFESESKALGVAATHHNANYKLRPILQRVATAAGGGGGDASPHDIASLQPASGS